METFPEPHPGTGPAAEVTVYEVGPRDGLQAEETVVPTATKVELVHRLHAAGLRTVEVTSFVPPRWVPQLADAEEVLGAVAGLPDARLPVLVPNIRGLERALSAGAREVAVVVSATEAFARANLGTGREEAVVRAEAVLALAAEHGVAARGYVSMAFGDPWEGRVAPRQVVPLVERLWTAGCARVSLGDTIGVATPAHVRALLTVLAGSEERLALHGHDTYGQALANAAVALEAGVRELDASAGGLGGCPYARSATGNLATEDLLWMLHGQGVSTGVSLPDLAATSAWLAGRLGRPSPSRVVRALTGGSS
ncbi:hydroxymethylglutaryl-CoA lyase [Auraticoccus monumenti]|uniref:Hydroxymethylglutaryl-CoA lyase n=1 Tax=Auraticoccus monumenti TaxID=675864 RepID=A0A1G7CIT9_9ACTN|nr:hydroxymethylglutaryl-CoA lyase [Auraticoccus monumenti]SDE39278.1 hydroxymethylglutaryl-CoA lyase [Auraticoccus monumenti]